MEREPEQKHSGKRCADPMTRNIDEPVQTEKDGGDKGGQPITLIGAFAQWINFSNQKNESDDDENDGDPTQLGPKPEPVAFRVNRAPVAIRSGAKRSEEHTSELQSQSNPVCRLLLENKRLLPPGVNRSLWDYLHAADLAPTYDAGLAGFSLFNLHYQVVARYLPRPGRLLAVDCSTSC